jgi:hypothetical protein
MINFDANKISKDVMSAIRSKAQRLTEDFRKRIVSTIYSSVHRRTGSIDKSIKPFVLEGNSSLTLGFDIDPTNSSHTMPHLMMTRTESSMSVIHSRAKLLTVPLVDYVYGKKASSMNLRVIPTPGHTFLSSKQGSSGKFKPEFVLEREVKIPKRVKMYDIMDKFESTVRREIQATAQDVIDKSFKG